MTLADRLNRRPRPTPGSFARIPRARFEQHCRALERQRDTALGQRRAHADWIASWLDRTAERYERAGHSPIAAELRALIHDLEEGPQHG